MSKNSSIWDVLSPAQRSWCMSRIKGKNTKPELFVRSLLHCLGYRYRLHRRDLPGKPDIVLPKYNTVIFVHGCFWHRHKGCKYSYIPKTRKAFWNKKFSDNIERDKKNRRLLKKSGWKVIYIWECEIKNDKKIAKKIEAIQS